MFGTRVCNPLTRGRLSHQRALFVSFPYVLWSSGVMYPANTLITNETQACVRFLKNQGLGVCVMIPQWEGFRIRVMTRTSDIMLQVCHGSNDKQPGHGKG